MTRRRAGGTRLDDAGSGLPSSVPEIGRLLRRARTRQGLRVEDVAARASLNFHQCEALESGTVDRIPDRVTVLKTLRRYADSLGLPGDRFVLALVEHWPASAPGQTDAVPMAVPLTGTADVRHVASSVAVGVPAVPAPVVTGGLPPGAVTRVGGTGLTQRQGDLSSITAQVPMVVNTGVTPAVRAAAPRQPAPWRTTVVLSVTIGVLTVAVVVGIAALLVHRYEPRWLSDLGITHSPSTPHHHGTGGTTSTSTTVTTAPAVTCTSTSPNAASCSVAASKFDVTVNAVGGPSWVQVTQSGQVVPTFSGVLAAGQSKVFANPGSLSLDLGSAAAHVTVTTGLRILGTYDPPSAPQTVTVSGTG